MADPMAEAPLGMVTWYAACVASMLHVCCMCVACVLRIPASRIPVHSRSRDVIVSLVSSASERVAIPVVVSGLWPKSNVSSVRHIRPRDNYHSLATHCWPRQSLNELHTVSRNGVAHS